MQDRSTYIFFVNFEITACGILMMIWRTLLGMAAKNFPASDLQQASE